MYSIFRLCDYDIPYSTVLKLKENNITCFTIINNPNCLNNILGKKSEKAEKIKVIIYELLNSDKNFSIYDLMYYGLSKNITELLIKNNISIDDINDELIKKDYITIGTFKKIMKSYNEFIINNNIKLKLTDSLLFSLIKKLYSYDSFDYEKIKNDILNYNYDITFLEDLLNKLINFSVLQKEGTSYFIIKPTIEDEINRIKNQKYKNMVRERLLGRTLESIANEYGITRERVRQIIEREINKFVITIEEEKYRKLFETYKFDCNFFCDFFDSEAYIYYYLYEKYKIGSIELYELFENYNLSRRELNVLKSRYNLISYKGENIVATKINILKAILKNAKKYMKYSDIMHEYNKIIEYYQLDIASLNANDDRNIDGILNRSVFVLCTFGKNYRYYDFNSIDEDNINNLKQMLEVEAGDYSTEFFFNNNKFLMKNMGIIDEYELHNLLRKVIGNYNGKIVYSRMPDILIDCNDKFEFIDKLIHKLSPIDLDEFVDYAYQNYGHKYNTFKSLLASNFNKYITNGKIISNCIEFTSKQSEILTKKLVEDIYSISTVKKLLLDLFNVNDFKLINNLNMSKLGYKLRGNYIMKNTISNLERYLHNIILNTDYFEIKEEFKKIGSTFFTYLYKFINELDLYKIGNEKYITIKKLNELGIRKDNIKSFIYDIEKVIPENKYFNLYILKKKFTFNNFIKYNFPDCFYETIISTISNIKTCTLKNNVLFIKTDNQVNRMNFINSFVTKNKISIDEIKENIYKNYNIDVSESYIKEFIDNKNYYFDKSSNCILNKDYFNENIDE